MIPDNVCVMCGNKGQCVDWKEDSYDIYFCPYCQRFWTIIGDENN